MKITIGNDTKKCLDILKIEYPFTYETLKTSYRKLLFENHPDHNGSKTRTIEIIKAYNRIKNLSINIDINFQKELIEKAEKDIFDFTEPCIICDGVGHTTHKVFRSPCLYCGFFKRGYKRCNACTGTGKFEQAKSKKIVTCLRCNGLGIMKCRTCRGTGYIGKNKIIKNNCFNCNGTGKIKLNPFNPVIPKGAIL